MRCTARRTIHRHSRRRNHDDGGDETGARQRRRDRELRCAAASADDVVDAIQWSVDGVRRMGGVPHVNHPELRMGRERRATRARRTAQPLRDLQRSPQVNNVGGGGVPGLEEMWDGFSPVDGCSMASRSTTRITSSGRVIPTASGPGRGWVLRARAGARAADDFGSARSRRFLCLDRRRAGRLRGRRETRSH